MRLSLTLLALLLGCRTGVADLDDPGGSGSGGESGADSGGESGGESGGTGDTTDDTGGGDDTGGSTGEDPGPDCSELPVVDPDAYDTYKGFSGAEDFAFDLTGLAVSVDENGNLLGQDIDGDTDVLGAGMGYTAGTRYMPDGTLVIARVDRGSLITVSPEGAKDQLASGMSYPNGVEVDLDGFVYVAEHDAGRVRRIDPETGDYEVIAEGLTNPNGLRFSPDWQTLFVGSFGGGTVHSITRGDGDEWDTQLFAGLPNALPEYPQPCDDKAEADRCTMIGGGHGTCVEGDDAELSCVWTPESEACETAEAGTACTSQDIDGNEVSSVCAEPIDGGDLICPAIEAERVEGCEGKAEWGSCKLDGKNGYCVDSWEEVRVCITQSEYNGAFDGTCSSSSSEGELCTSDYLPSPWEGTCIDYYGAMYCQPYGTSWSEEGGLDGINVDECDNVYVSEYVTGRIWRFPAAGTPDGAEAEVIFELPSQWIPNLRWGSGVGGWDKDKLYVMDRMTTGMFELDVGLSGGDVAYQTEGSSD